MKSKRFITLILLMGAILCLNGGTCLPCLVSFLLHPCRCQDHCHEQSTDSSWVCPVAPSEVKEEHRGHPPRCPDRRAHSCEVHFTPVLSIQVDSSNKPLDSNHFSFTPFPEWNPYAFSSVKLEGRYNFNEPFPDLPLYLQYAQLLI
jgi:hypothetical protein